MTAERTERLPLPKVEHWKQIKKNICSAASSAVAAFIIAKVVDYNEENVEPVMAMIDNLDPLTAAFILTEFRIQEKTAVGYEFRFAQRVVARAVELKIRGSAGLCFARDVVYRETGFFAGT